MGQTLNIKDIKKLYLNEWVLVGNPVIDSSKIDVLSGIPIYHSQDKKEVYYIGRDKTANFDKINFNFYRNFQICKKDYRYFQPYKIIELALLKKSPVYKIPNKTHQ